jgi:uncharacterized membrane protein YkvA (DUF1232 family)
MKGFQRLYRRTRGLWLQCVVLYYAFSNRQTPWYAKALIVVTLLYLISPIDIIPDFIPIAGYLDDIIIVPLLFTLATRLVPVNIMKVSHIRAEERLLVAKRNVLKTIVLSFLWVFVAVIVIKYLVIAIRN